jgi:hypothetical protein
MSGAAVVFIYGRFGLLPYLSEQGVSLVFGDGIGLFDKDGAIYSKKKNSEDDGTDEKAKKTKVVWKKGMKITQEMIDEGHELYMRKLTELFDSEKERFGYGDRELEIF